MCLHNSSQIVSLETLEALRTINCWKSHLHLLRVNPSSLLVKILFCQNLCCLPLTTGSSGETHHFTLLRYFFKFLCCISLAGLDILLTCNVTSTESLPFFHMALHDLYCWLRVPRSQQELHLIGQGGAEPS